MAGLVPEEMTALYWETGLQIWSYCQMESVDLQIESKNLEWNLVSGLNRKWWTKILICIENIQTGSYRHRGDEYLMEDINMYWIFQEKKLWIIFMGWLQNCFLSQTYPI